MFSSLVSALLGDSTPPIPEGSDARSASQPVLNTVKDDHSQPQALERFNECVTQIHHCMAESDYEGLVQLFQDAARIVRDTAFESIAASKSSSQGNVCPQCGRTVASVQLHLRSCTGEGRPAQSSDSGSSDPRMEVLSALRQRAVSHACAALEQAVARGDADQARVAWCTATSLYEIGDPPSTHDPSLLFGALVESVFMAYCQDVEEERVQRRKEREGTRGAGAAAVHPLLLAHYQATVHAGRKLHGRLSGQPTDGLTALPNASTASMDAALTIIGEAATWLEQIRNQQAPHSARVAVASRLLSACTRVILPCVADCYRDMSLEAVLAIARASMDHAEGRASHSDYGTARAWLWEWDRVECADRQDKNVVEASSQHVVAQPEQGDEEQDADYRMPTLQDLKEAERRRLDESFALFEEPILLVRFDGTSDRGSASKAASSLPPIPLPVTVAVAILEGVCDQMCFLAALLEKFVRHAQAVLASGRADEPTRGTDELSASLQALQGQYVLLERAYLLNAIQRALAGGPRSNAEATSWKYDLVRDGWSWSPVSVHEDSRVHTFAWCDALFYICGKSITRAMGTGCDMAAAAVCNFAAGVLDEQLRSMVSLCVRMCAGTRAVPSRTGSTGKQQRGSDVEDEVAEAIGQALSGQSKRTTASPRTEAVDEEESQRILATLPPLTEEALCALNTVATVGLYAASLYARVGVQAEQQFPAPMRDTSVDGANGGPAPDSGGWDPAALAYVPRVHPALRVPLETLQTVAASFAFNQPPVSSTHPRQGGRPVKVSYVQAACTCCVMSCVGAGLATLRAALQSTGYSINQQDYEAAEARILGSSSAHRNSAAFVGLPAQPSSSLPTGDPALAVYHSKVLGLLRLHLLLPLLLQPVLADGVLRAVSRAVAAAVEQAWGAGDAKGAGGGPVSEYGALLMSSQLRVIMEELEAQGLRAAGHRATFARITQSLAILSLDAPHDLYTLSFPAPKLTQAEVRGLMARRGWAAAKINWDRVQTVLDPENDAPY